MAKEDIAPYQQNLAFKRAFERLRLDLPEVMEFTPLDVDLENRRLQNLLDFVDRYQRCGGREAMEAIAGSFVFPPIFPGISPESDWYRFEQWMQGKPVRQKLSEQLSKNAVFSKPEDIGDGAIEAELERLEAAINRANYGISLNEGIPPRLVYAYLYENLGQTFELDEPSGGGWFLDGCSGYCPGCFQRPWCPSGEGSCWPEDEAAGKMHLIDELSAYVSASPQSLEILQRLQAAEDASFERFKAENPDSGFGDFEEDSEWKAKQN